MLIILDRDGVINHDSPNFIRTPEEWQPIDGSLEAMAKLTQAGHTIVVATNQSGIGRGYYTLDTLAAIHQKMCDAVRAAGGRISHIYYCPHHPDDHCRCRKPQPGMLQDIARDYPTLWPGAVMIGDSARDVASAQAAGCSAILLHTGNGLEDDAQVSKDVPRYDNLQAAVESLMQK